MREAPLSLHARGQILRGWQRVEVSLGVDQLSGTFNLTLVDARAPSPRSTEQGERASPVLPVPAALRAGAVSAMDEQRSGASPAVAAPGDACRITVGDETLITGWVDEREPGYDARDHRVSVRGRDVTGDLADCSGEPAGRRWQQQTLLQIAQDLCRPFGIRVQLDGPGGERFESWSLTPGETPLECLRRAAAYRGLLLGSDGAGALRLFIPSRRLVATPLQRGVNILSASGLQTLTERYSSITLLAQQTETDDTHGVTANEVLARVTDTGVPRHRPLVLVSEDAATPSAAQARAQWERNTRRGRSLQVNVTVAGWSHPEGLWRPDRQVHVLDPWLGLDQPLYVVACRYLLDDQGHRCVLTLMPPEAFDVLAEPEPLP